jgi:hypothetical protein
MSQALAEGQRAEREGIAVAKRVGGASGYAGPAPTWYGILAIVLFLCALAGLAAYLGAR